MDHATPDDVAALALDPASVSPEVRDHVASCPSCRALQAGLVAVADGLRRGRDDGPLVAPPDDVRRRVLAAAATGSLQQPGPDAQPEPQPEQRLAAQPPPRTVASVRERRRGVPVWAAGLAAAVTLVAGLGIGRLTVGGTDPAPPADLVASAELTTVEGTDGRGLARAVRTADREDDVVTLRINAEALGEQDGIHEVWLIHTDGTRMVAVGLLAAGDEGEFEVPVELLDAGYRIVDISVEPEDGDPTHSGVSLARGELT